MNPPASERTITRRRANKRRKSGLFAVWGLEVIMTLALIGFVAHFMGHRPLLAAAVLIVGTIAFSVLCYVLLNREILERMKMLKSGLSAEQGSPQRSRRTGRRKIPPARHHEPRNPHAAQWRDRHAGPVA